jgi:hypothetical protein
MTQKSLNFETKGKRHKRKSKVVPKIRKGQTRGTTFIKKLIAPSYDTRNQEGTNKGDCIHQKAHSFIV